MRDSVEKKIFLRKSEKANPQHIVRMGPLPDYLQFAQPSLTNEGIRHKESVQFSQIQTPSEW